MGNVLKIKSLLKDEISGWKIGEILWLLVASLVIFGLSIYWKDNLMGIVSALTGVICVICTGKGKLSAYLFGLVNCVLYAIISYKARLYGETMLNIIYYVPMQFVGFYIWSKNMNKETKEVNKVHISNKERLLWLFVMIGATIIYGYILMLLGDAMPYVDSFTTVSSIVAMIISVKMCSEQWWIWIVVDIFTVYMWLVNFMTGSENIATLLMWGIYLVNAFIMCYKWEKEIYLNKKAKTQKISKELVKDEI